MDQQLYRTAIAQALEALPSRIRKGMEDVVIVVEESPRARPGAYPIRKGHILLGLYEGVPLTAWGREYSGKLPDKITLFAESIEHVAGTLEEVPHVIRETLWHEIGHFFGLDHEKIRRMEERWRKMKDGNE